LAAASPTENTAPAARPRGVILADTSVWADHLRRGDKVLAALLDEGQIAIHPYVIGELALGELRTREAVIDRLHDLPQTTVATAAEILQFIARHALYRLGIGYVDTHLLAAAQLTGILLWTRDKRLHRAAERLGLAATLRVHIASLTPIRSNQELTG
jgi:hypothetical protein